ncbi:MAG: mercury resistance system transport protein MerF [Candidatus Rokuibacteriota bacterium]
MWRDRWLKIGILGSLLACIACLTPAAVVLLGALGLAAWTGYIDVVAVPLLGAFLILAAYRVWSARRSRGYSGSN